MSTSLAWYPLLAKMVRGKNKIFSHKSLVAYQGIYCASILELVYGKNKIHLKKAIIIMHMLDASFTSQGYQVHFLDFVPLACEEKKYLHRNLWWPIGAFAV